MKIRIDERIYEGTGEEIMEQLRLETFDPTEYPDTESYIWQLRSNFMRATDLECDLPETGVERQARAMIDRLAKAGSLEVLDDG
ncbi:MAG: hypothetical protein HFF40_04070 [Lawsonibacter sp.]|jgi:hypothetical protein|nr:hypothetical protein [Lawsonibacter sp.]